MAAQPRNQKSIKLHGGRRKGAGRRHGGRNQLTIALGATLSEMAKPFSGEALAIMVGVMRSSRVSPKARAFAAGQVLDRAWGKPRQSVEHSGKDGAPIITQQLPALPPVPVAIAVRKLIEGAEKKMGLQPAKGLAAEERMRRVLEAGGEFPHPDLYEALWVARQADERDGK